MVVLEESNGFFERLGFLFPSPNVAKEAAAETLIKSITASFRPTTLHIKWGWFITGTKINTNKDIKQTVYQEL